MHGRLSTTDGVCVVATVHRTTNAFERMRGLLGRPPLGEGEGLLLTHCAAVHSMGMRYALDLVFLDRDWTVRKIVGGLQPWRLAACRGASMTLEMATGAAERLALEPGMPMTWCEIAAA